MAPGIFLWHSHRHPGSCCIPGLGCATTQGERVKRGRRMGWASVTHSHPVLPREGLLVSPANSIKDIPD